MNIFWKVNDSKKLFQKPPVINVRIVPKVVYLWHLHILRIFPPMRDAQWRTGENWPITDKDRRVPTFSELGGKRVKVSQRFTLFGTIIFLFILKPTRTHTKSTDKILKDFQKNYSSHAIVSLSQLTLGTGPLSAVILDELVQKVHLCRICL